MEKSDQDVPIEHNLDRQSLDEQRERAAYDLTDELLAVGHRRLPDTLRNRILKMGSVCVQPLIQIFNDEELHMTDGPGEGWASIHAAELLGDMKAEKAIPFLVHWVQVLDFDIILHSTVVQALGKMGAPAVAPLLQAFRETDDIELRRSICDALAHTHFHDDAVFEVLAAFLDEDLELGTVLLAEYGDPRALPVLQRALDDYAFSDAEYNMFVHQEVIELYAAIEELGGQPTRSQQEKYDRARALRRSARALMDIEEDIDDEAFIQMPIQKEKKLGRNEPCWCGSGKKYKRCHWASDKEEDR